ncbi:MAG TPA: MBL fold metallo-hydrolase [Candidatus Cloacimonadota bacterium]|nr:MBL fold metallo-hydrolase [Candidatus Cloacimonadota bacterium]HOD54802.1 MBL fold metallo-hydrolase [Candidatus Cloacimonadota bacterium]HPM01258.1 MBL fold metallo-hydrolase [Candidatus Cloacimonadota bacterium]
MVQFNQINDYITVAQASTLKVNAVVIDCGDFLTLIDTLLLPSDIKALKHFLKEKQKPLKYLINTHWHSDHCLGNQMLRDEGTIIIAHQDYLDTLLIERKVLHQEKNNRSIFKSAKVKHHSNNHTEQCDILEETHSKKQINRSDLVHPNILIKEEVRFHDSFTWHLIESPGHCYGALCVFIEELKVLITGDTVLGFPEGFFSIPYFYWGDPLIYMTTLKRLDSFDFNLIIPGHSEIQSKELILFYLQYLVRIILKKDELLDVKDDYTLDELKNLIKAENCLEVIESRPLWVPEMHDLNLEKLFLTYFKK